MVSVCRRFCAAGAAALLLLLAAAAGAQAQGAGVPGAARFWFYRVFFPNDTGSMPAVAMNGASVGYAVAGTSFYRDVPAGLYHVTVESDGLDYYQSRWIAVAPGQEVYVKIASLPNWQESARGTQRRATYYVMHVSPYLAGLELPLTRYTAGY